HKEQLKHKLFSKMTFVRTGVGAAWSEAWNTPHEWGRTMGGFAKRAGSSYGQRAIKGVVEYSVASTWTHEDLRYRPSGLHGRWPRLKYGLGRAGWVPRDTPGGNTVAVGRASGAIAAGQISRAWMPQRVATVGAGFSSAGISIGIDAGFNVLREFWP